MVHASPSDGADRQYHGVTGAPTAEPLRPSSFPVPACPFVDKQIIKVQEDPSNIPEGETPRSLLMYAFDTNVDACKPGDKVTVTGGKGMEEACARVGWGLWGLATQGDYSC